MRGKNEKNEGAPLISGFQSKLVGKSIIVFVSGQQVPRIKGSKRVPVAALLVVLTLQAQMVPKFLPFVPNFRRRAVSHILYASGSKALHQ